MTEFDYGPEARALANYVKTMRLLQPTFRRDDGATLLRMAEAREGAPVPPRHWDAMRDVADFIAEHGPLLTGVGAITGGMPIEVRSAVSLNCR
jgi:hypothetical protein